MAPLPPANPGTASPFGDYSVRIDPWAVDYGGETPTEFQPDAEDAPELDLNIEQDVATWAPITPPVAPSSQPLSFVDGVRRMEARLVVTRHGRTVHGALGCVRRGRGGVSRRARDVCRGTPRPRRHLRRRRDAPSGSRACAVAPLPAPQRCRGGCRCAAARTARRDASAGGAVCSRSLPRPERIVIADGPLNVGDPTRRPRRWLRQAAVQALSAARAAARAAGCCRCGARTPVFLISQRRYASLAIRGSLRIAKRLSRSNPTSRDSCASSVPVRRHRNR